MIHRTTVDAHGEMDRGLESQVVNGTNRFDRGHPTHCLQGVQAFTAVSLAWVAPAPTPRLFPLLVRTAARVRPGSF